MSSASYWTERLFLSFSFVAGEEEEGKEGGIAADFGHVFSFLEIFLESCKIFG